MLKTSYNYLDKSINYAIFSFLISRRILTELLGSDYNFATWADIWYENHKDNVKPTTQENYRYTLRILKDHFERRQLDEIKAMDIEQFLKKLRRDGRADSTIAQCRGMLYQIFNKAEANDLVRKNPVRFAEKMRKRPAKRKEAFTAEEVKLLLEKLPEDQVGWGYASDALYGYENPGTPRIGTQTHSRRWFVDHNRTGCRYGKGNSSYWYT